MTPAKPNRLYKEAAARIPYSEEIIKSVVSTYYQMIRELITSASDLRVEIKDLGYFTFKYWKLPELVERFETAVAETKYEGVLKADREKKLEELKRLLKLSKKQKELEKLKKQEQIAYVKDKQNKESLGE